MEIKIGMSYKINHPSVISQVMDDEIVIINLQNGIYYNIQGYGIVIWKLLESGLSSDKIKSLVTERITEPREAIGLEIEQFIVELLSEELIVIREGIADEETVERIMPVIDALKDNPTPWNSLIVNKYTDMQDLLLLDPIHDVNEAGWPNSITEQDDLETVDRDDPN